MRGLAAVLSAMTAAMGVRLASDNFLTDDTWPSIVQHRRCQGITNGTNLTDTNSTPYHCQLVAISRGHRYFAFKGQDNKEKCETYPSCDATYPSNKVEKQWAIYEYKILVDDQWHVPGTWYITVTGSGIGSADDTHVVTGYKDDTWTMVTGYGDDTWTIDCPSSVIRGSVSGDSSISTFCRSHESAREGVLTRAAAQDDETPDFGADLDFGTYRYFKPYAPPDTAASVDGVALANPPVQWAGDGRVFYDAQDTNGTGGVIQVCGSAIDTVEFSYYSSIWVSPTTSVVGKDNYWDGQLPTFFASSEIFGVMHGVWSSPPLPKQPWNWGNGWQMRAKINEDTIRFSHNSINEAGLGPATC